jgi:2-iminobutanoate/2-iminopropanoate deaminase
VAVAFHTARENTGEEAAADRPEEFLEGPSMDRQVVTGPGLPPPIGPYSGAVRAGGFVFVSGQPGVDPATGEVPADFPAMNALFEEFFPTEPPARMTMQVPLPRGLLISIGCTAVEAP